MQSPFPGMDPYLEGAELWPDVHDSLIVGIRDEIGPRIAPKYFTRLNRRTYLLHPDDLELVGLPDLAVLTARPKSSPEAARPVVAGAGVLEVELPFEGEVSESYLEIRAGKNVLVTTLEILSPVNKLHSQGRLDYLTKRNQIIGSMTNLVEIDLLRDGPPMPVLGAPPPSDYRILVRRGFSHPSAHLHHFGVRDPIPEIAIPLQSTEEAVSLNLGAILRRVFANARYDLEIDYRTPPVPALRPADAEWASGLVA